MALLSRSFYGARQAFGPAEQVATKLFCHQHGIITVRENALATTVIAGSITYKVYPVTQYSGTVHEVDYTPNSD